MRFGHAVRNLILAGAALALGLLPARAQAQGSIVSGQTVNGSIVPGGATTTWTFSANAGDAFLVGIGELTQVGNISPRIAVYNPSSALVTSGYGTSAARIAGTASASGTYTVIVDDAALGQTGSGTYQLTLALSGHAPVVSSGDEGGAMTNGVRHTGTITMGDIDVWTVHANAGDALIARVGELVSGSALTPLVAIYSPAGVQLSVGYGAAAGEAAANAPLTGEYMVITCDNNVGVGGTGGYQLCIARSGAPVTTSVGDEGGATTNGVMHTGTIDIGDIDVWTVDLNAGDAVVARIGELVAGSALTPGLRLYSPAGVLLSSGYGASAGEVSANAPLSGQYMIVAGDNNVGLGASGGYRLTVARTGAPVVTSGGDEGGPLTNGVMHTGSIDTGDLDVWTVDAVAGDAIVARIGETAAGSALTPALRIYSPAGVLLDSGYGANAGEIAIAAPSSGQYVLLAGDNNVGLGGIGGYRVTLARSGAAVTTSAGDEGGATSNGAMHLGTIDMGDLDLWTVTLTVGDAIVARVGETVTGSSLTPMVRIYTPAGVLLSSSYGANAGEAAGTAPISGQYLMVIGDNTSGLGGTGGYRLSVVRTGAPVNVSPGDEGGAMTNGVMHTGTIDMGDIDAWTVDAVAGDALLARVGETTVGSGLTPAVRIYSPAGVLLDSGYGAGAGDVTVTAPSSGQYVVIVSDNNNGLGGTGGYRLTLAKSNTAIVTSPGDQGGPLTALSGGTIDTGDLDLWSLNAVAGQPLVAAMEEIVIGSSLSPQLLLYSPTGALLASNYGASRAQVNATANVTGTYLLVACDNSSGVAGTGAYRLAPNYTTGTDEAPRVFTLAFAAPAPNPVVSRTTLHYSLPRESRVALHVYDAQGRVVRTLVDEAAKPAGEYAIEWDGRGSDGALLSPGVYLARMQAAGRSLVQKVLIAR